MVHLAPPIDYLKRGVAWNSNASGGFGEQEWLIVELDASYNRDVVLPRQIALHTRAGLPVALASKELRLLRYLVDQRGRVIPREELLRNVWEYQNEVSPRTVDVHVAWLRQKLEENPQNPRHIHTIRGKGYRFLP